MTKKKKRILAAAVAAAAVVLAGVGIWRGTRPGEVTNYEAAFEPEQEAPGDGTGEAAAAAAGIQIPGYKSITIPAGTRDVSVELMNPEENQVYFQISLYLPETEETIYQSDLLRPGQHLYEITLEKEMEAGEYPLIVRYAAYSADENLTPKNGAEVSCTLKVQEDVTAQQR